MFDPLILVVLAMVGVGFFFPLRRLYRYLANRKARDRYLRESTLKRLNQIVQKDYPAQRTARHEG